MHPLLDGVDTRHVDVVIRTNYGIPSSLGGGTDVLFTILYQVDNMVAPKDG